MKFKLQSNFKPAGDQPKAIEQLNVGLNKHKQQTLLGVTGSGKTFTMANVIAEHQKPTLILSHNKSLAAQLFEEFKLFFPENNVNFFISYYDYYQPESYIAQTDTYIEKDVQINEKIEQMRMEAIDSLLTHDDTIIISSVSCIYGLGDPVSFKNMSRTISKGQTISRQDFISDLISIQYERNDTDLRPAKFRVRGDVIDLIQGSGQFIVRLEFYGDEIEKIKLLHTITQNVLEEVDEIIIFPATPFIYEGIGKEDAIASIEKELADQLPKLDVVEAHRLKQRTEYDLEMIKELGYCKGIENYSRHMDGRNVGEPPSCLLDFFPDDFLFFIDESHVTIPQINGMYKGDRARKQSLIENGFRLPSAFDNRPLKFNEFEKYLHKVIYVSATPGDYELENSKHVVEQIIRPTGLVDPEIFIHPSAGQVEHLINEIEETVKKGYRVLVTTLTKRMSEELNQYFIEHHIKSHYLHSEIDTLERIEIIRDLRLGKFDVLIGINLLREGLDLPEVALVAILDADKEGFLRTSKSLVQTIGRAARNNESKVIMYADKETKSMKAAIDETNRRREIQMAYNNEHNIKPQSITKSVQTQSAHDDKKGKKRTAYNIAEEIIRVETKMQEAADRLNFEKAIELRDQLKTLRKKL